MGKAGNVMLDVIDLNLEFHDHLVPETVVYHFNLHMEEGDIIGLVGGIRIRKIHDRPGYCRTSAQT